MTKITHQIKYLLLMEPEEKFPEQLNSYVFLIMEIILLAKRTNRIFVLPHLHSHPRNNSLAEKGETDHRKFILGRITFPMEKVFDKDLLNKYVPVISFEEFVKLTQKRLSVLFCFGARHYNLIDSYGETFYCEQIHDSKDTRDIERSNAKFVGVTGYRKGRYLVPSSPNWPKEFEKDYWEIRKHLKFHPDLVKKAKKFIQDKKLGKYIAVHWRRGDRVHPEMTTLAEVIVDNKKEMKNLLEKFLIEPIKSIMKDYDLQKVFLATNSGTKWHLDYLKKRVPIIQYPPSGSWKKREVESIVEQIICAQSDYFIAAPFSYQHCSSFSRWIIDSRIINGSGNTVSHQQKMDVNQNQTEKKAGILESIRGRILSVLVPIVKRVLSEAKAIVINISERQNIKTVPITFFNNHSLIVDSRTLTVGGSWMPKKRWGKPQINDSKILEIFYKDIRRNESVVLYDIGASTGSFSLLAKFVSKIQVYAFEPQLNIFSILLQNIKINGLTQQVMPFQIALSDKNGVLPLQVPSNISQSGLATLGTPLRFTSSRTVCVACIKLDSFVKKFNLQSPTHIKIDTEGAELLVLNGAKNIIKKSRPTILTECSEKNTQQFGYHAEEIINLISSWGYNISYVNNEDILCVPARRK